MNAPLPDDETERLAALRAYLILDSPPEAVFDAITRLAARICVVPVAAINLVDADRQWFKSRIGLDVQETPRESGICTKVVLHAHSLIIPDTSLDPRFADNPFVNARPGIRFYAGVPLLTPENHVLGTLCVIDHVPRQLSAGQIGTLNALADEVMIQLELRQKNSEATALPTRLESILNAAGEGICGVDSLGKTTFVNPAAAHMLGWEMHELIGKSVREVFYPCVSTRDLTGQEACPLCVTLANNQPHQCDDEIFWRKDGSYFSAKYTSAPLRGEGKQPGAVVIFEDISARKQAEDALRDSERHYRVVTETATDAIITIDADSTMLVVNQAAEQIFGYRIEDIVGQKLSMLMPASMRHLHENGLQHYLESGERRIAWDGIELLGLHRDGRHIPLDISFGESTRAGKPTFTGIIRDASARKLSELALKNSEERYRFLYEANPSIYFTVDIHGITLSVNNFGAEQLGYRVDELVGQPGLMVIHKDDRALAHRRFLDCVRERTTQVANWEIRKLRRDGSVLWAKETVRVVRGADGQQVVLIVCQDISDRKQAQDALETQAQELLRSKTSLEKQTRILQSILDSMGDGVIVADEDGKLLFMNPAAEHIIGYGPDETLPDQTTEQFCAYLPAMVSPGARNEIPLARAIRGEAFNAAEVLMPHAKASKPAWLSVTGRPLKDQQGVARGGVVVFRDNTEQKHNEQRLNYLANYDALTGLPNRSLFADRLNQALARARWQNRLMAVLFLDLDRFKIVNDTLGHAIGDILLKSVAERLTTCVREGDTVSRLSGDEFTLILADIAQQEDVALVVQKIQAALLASFRLEQHEIFVTASIGVSIYPSDGCDAEALLKNADVAMYRAKEQGKNRSAFYSSAMGAQISERMRLENALRHALEREELLLHYQPLVEVQTGQIVGLEALLRWVHPDMGTVPPDVFIPLAEDNGLIVPIGEWVLRTACAQTQAWHEQGLGRPRIAVNLSARQFQQQNMYKVIALILHETGLEPGFLEVELTESIMQNLDAVGALRSLREAGVQIVIDDFGTGYSSLNYLKHFPVDKLKIDRSFISGIPTDSDNTAITTAIIAMARTLKLKVVAEGVENSVQMEFLQTLDCDEAQGFLLSRPLPADKISQMLGARPLLDDTYRAARSRATYLPN